MKDNKLCAKRVNATWKLGFEFEHVSGEFFIARISSLVVPDNDDFKSTAPVEFIIGSEGVVKKLGIEFEYMGKDGLVWFERA